MNAIGVQKLGMAKSVDGIHFEKLRSNPVLDVGITGSFDENGLGEPSVFFSYPNFYMIFVGRDAHEYRNLGLAVSRDGVNWRKTSTIGLFSPTQRQAWDSKVICDPSVLQIDQTHLMLYFGGGDVAEPAENLHGNVGLAYASISDSDAVAAFDAGDDFSIRQPSDILVGSYGVEDSGGHKYVWVNRNAKIEMSKQGAAYLHVNLYTPVTSYKAKGIDEPLKIDIAVNGKLLKTITSDKDQSFDMDIPLSSDNQNVSQSVTFTANEQLPSSAADERNLSFIISQIKLN